MIVPLLKGIDHIHIYVNDKTKAVGWYSKVLGFKIYEPLKLWDNKTGPLTMSDASDTVHLAFFEREKYEPLTSLALKTTAKGFIEWKEHLEKHGLKIRIADHQVAWSLYFNDPFGHSHEITTREYEQVKSDRHCVLNN